MIMYLGLSNKYRRLRNWSHFAQRQLSLSRDFAGSEELVAERGGAEKVQGQ